MAKSKYLKWLEKENLTRIEGWARSGLTDVQIAKNMGIAMSTLNEWKNKYPAIMESLKRGKDVADFEVENALHKRATGFVKKIVKTETLADGDTKTVVILDEVPPDTTAAIYWLKNRKPGDWRT